MGLAWSLFIASTNKNISFINDGIQYQFPLLFVAIIVKYVILVMNGYKTSRKLFYTNLAVYIVYLLLIVVIDRHVYDLGIGHMDRARRRGRATLCPRRLEPPPPPAELLAPRRAEQIVLLEHRQPGAVANRQSTKGEGLEQQR